jgi:hypothetical protein
LALVTLSRTGMVPAFVVTVIVTALVVGFGETEYDSV